MDAKSARELVDSICAEIDAKRESQPRFAALMKQARTLGLGIALGLAVSGCGDDDENKVPGPDAAYGVPDSYLHQDMLASPDAAYGMPDFLNIHDVSVDVLGDDGGPTDAGVGDGDPADGPTSDDASSSDAQ